VTFLLLPVNIALLIRQLKVSALSHVKYRKQKLAKLPKMYHNFTEGSWFSSSVAHSLKAHETLLLAGIFRKCYHEVYMICLLAICCIK